MAISSYEFEHGYVKPIGRGIYFWNGSEDGANPGSPEVWLEDLVYEAIGDRDAWTGGYNLKGIKVTIEVQESTRQ